MFKLLKNNKGFGLMGILVGLLILSVAMAAALPYLKGENNLRQANGAINTANSLIKSEIQYQQASYSNDAESGTPNTDYFGTVSQMINGMTIKPSNYYQQFLSNGEGLSLLDYQGNNNCVNEPIENNTITECITDERNGQFQLSTYGLNNLPANYVTMFDSGIKGGVTGYSGGVLITQVSVPFGFSAYPKIQGNTTTTNNTYSGGGGGGSGSGIVTISLGGGGTATLVNNGQGGGYVIGETAPAPLYGIGAGPATYYGNTCIANCP
ncbi:MAG: pilus assembly FimT family protein [bacterium]